MTDILRDQAPTLRAEHARHPDKADEHEVRGSADLELHIEELVLTGFAPSDRHRIGDAVEHELSRLLGANGIQGLGSAPITLERLDAGKFKVAQGARAQSIGGQIAQTLYRGISPVNRKATARNSAKR